MKIVIVGSSLPKWKTEEQIDKAKVEIRRILWSRATEHRTYPEYDKIIVVSGHCHELGVDIWAEEIAKQLGVKTEIYPAEVHQWEDKYEEWFEYDTRHNFGNVLVGKKLKGYRSRDIDMAKAGNIGYTIEPAGSCRHCGGKGWIDTTAEAQPKNISNCPKCKGTGAYSGGTFTINQMKKMGKEVHQIVIT